MKEVSVDQLCEAVESTHGCKATLRKVAKVQLYDNQPVWKGVVHIFDVDHPETNTCYAWSSPIEGTEKRRFYAVLGIHPIDAPFKAVQAAIVAEHKQR